MIRFITALISGLCLVSSAMAATGRVEGTVRAANHEPLAGALVEIEGRGLATRTDARGQYSLEGLRSGVVVALVASRDRFKTKRTTAYITEGTTFVDFSLELSIIEERVTVEAEIPLLNVSDRISSVALSPDQIAILPSLGEKDIFRALQLLPGVSGSRETSSGLYVRGGTPSQNLISYDGFTVYHVDHLFGYFSAFNMDAVEKIQLSKSAFDARDGGRLSGVLDLTGKAGRRDRPGASVGVSLLSAHAIVESPLGGKASAIIAGRRSFQGPLYNKILDLLGSESAGPRVAGPPGAGRFTLFESEPSSYFYDANGKLLLEPSGRDRMELSVYHGHDTVDNSRSLTIPDFMRERMIERGFEPPESFDISDTRGWGNLGVGAQWRRSWGRGVVSRLSLGRSLYDDKNERASRANETGSANVEDNVVEDATVRLDVTAPLRWNHLLEIGVIATRNDVRYDFETSNEARLRPGVETDVERPQFGGLLARDEQATPLSAYMQDRWTLFRKLTLASGIRLTRYDKTAETFAEPRVSVNLALTERLRIKGAWGVQHQFVNRISREDFTRGNREFWTLSDGTTVPVACARQIAAGLIYETRNLLVDVEIFNKELRGLSQFAPQFGPRTEAETIDLEQFFYHGDGRARGLEVLVQKKYGHHTGWLSYTLSRVEHEFPDLDVQRFPADHDQTHEIKAVDSIHMGEWTISGTWIYATGRPYTEPMGVETTELLEGFAFDRLLLGSRNAARLPSYHRMDVAAGRDLRIGSARGNISVTVFNLYGHRNVWYKEFQIIEEEILENDILLMGRTLNISGSVRF